VLVGGVESINGEIEWSQKIFLFTVLVAANDYAG
jgi:hypothetical protein